MAVACPRCGKPVLIESIGNAGYQLGEIIPSGPASADVAGLPPDIERFYLDAKRVLDAGVPDAAAVQLGRTLEAAAAHFGIDDGVLVKRIEALIEQGYVTKDFGRALHVVRRLRNVGAHYGDESVDGATAKQALRFTTQMLRNLFEIPAELNTIEGNDSDQTNE